LSLSVTETETLESRVVPPRLLFQEVLLPADQPQIPLEAGLPRSDRCPFGSNVVLLGSKSRLECGEFIKKRVLNWTFIKESYLSQRHRT